MKPIIFKEQLKLQNLDTKDTNKDTSLSPSLWNYKIDYNDFLGSGLYGSVYGLVKRPEESAH